MVTVEVETKEFNKRLKKFLQGSNVDIDKAIRKAGFDVLSRILGYSPVDTGQSRSGWHASMKQLGVSYDLSSNLKSTSKVALGKSQGSFKDHTAGQWNKYIEMVNGVNHIIYIEYGCQAYAPRAPVRRALRQYRAGSKNLGSLTLKSLESEWKKARL